MPSDSHRLDGRKRAVTYVSVAWAVSRRPGGRGGPPERQDLLGVTGWLGLIPAGSSKADAESPAAAERESRRREGMALHVVLRFPPPNRA